MRVEKITVDKLIRILQKYPSDMRVVLQGYEGGLDDLVRHCICCKEIKLDVNDFFFYGEHEINLDEEEYDERAVIIRRRGC